MSHRLTIVAFLVAAAEIGFAQVEGGDVPTGTRRPDGGEASVETREGDPPIGEGRGGTRGQGDATDAPPLPDPRIVVGLGAGGDGHVCVLAASEGDWAPIAWLRVPWTAYNASCGSAEPAIGDVDGDGTSETVVGLGERHGGGWIAVFDDEAHGRSFVRWLRLPWAAYGRDQGQTHVAVGDIDGDGRDEVVIGTGRYEQHGGWWGVFDDAQADWAFLGWRRLPWSQYDATNGEVRSAVGDVDGDGRDEVVLCTSRGGHFLVLDDAVAGFIPIGWKVAGPPLLRDEGRGIRASLGDVDGDGRDEIAVGFDEGGKGLIELRADADAGFDSIGWIALPWSAYNDERGETHPALGDLDKDGRADLVCGLGRQPRGEAVIATFRRASGGFRFAGWTRIPREGSTRWDGATWPAVEDGR